MKNKPFDSETFLKGKIHQSESQMKLPFWKEEHRAMPNHIARSGLFSPVKKGSRSYLNKEIISSRCDVEITYSGLKLDESDADLWMLLLHKFRNTSAGDKYYIYRAELLTDLGKSKGSESYKWLDDSMNRLHGSIQVTSKRYKVSCSLLLVYALDTETNQYYFQIDKSVVKLFSNKEFSLIQWDKRKKLKNSLSKFLQRLISASSSIEQSFLYSELNLKLRRSTEIKYLKRALLKACEELLEKRIIINYKLQKLKLKIWRVKI